ncbi:exopolysaccharide biosynthesis polyprenyl glycosylphosphotransferase [Dokdonia sp. Hel_I_53]|uniref:exopolysaccharide biosynthesis polyprenyl glycosylphosphotransferase n=1 Tax=Dokdonia sp. Hel_I_53 TaxID=1566287 RepID=UPI00119BEE8A|nr:exopolysaccharide biosynthesis polyprenyl glycosylphosphotransferase [Dokdonia sp. Hel_I_53]TVZ52670.1 putative colanic acid biosynthesis UDP-glucose lipid carrier transferase [Dokdonia sp. Hel_I_53]
MAYRVGRYSVYIRPIILFLDIVLIIAIAKLFLIENNHFVIYVIYIAVTWFVTCYKSHFYDIYRYTKPVRIISLLVLQFFIFTLLVFAFFGLFQDAGTSPQRVLKYVTYVFLGITSLKFGVFYLLKTYRAVLGGNHRNVVILGRNKETEELTTFFYENKEYGYEVHKIFDINEPNVSLNSIFSEILSLNVDEVYCSIEQFTNEQLREIAEFTDNHLKLLKFIPDNRELFTKKLEYQYLGITPILSLRRIPIDAPLNHFTKRFFDIVMSIVVIVGVLSWLTPLLAILIKLDSKGPVFFKQKRNGLDYHEFDCYKFRSMLPNDDADLEQVSKNDKRITPIGSFLRKTSIDELPQFINVIKGDMSVVGPRPHMVSHTHMYAERIDKFMVRHFIKPGITGLAQVSGYRGEVENDGDIVNRVKYDIFYVENWSLFLDVKIVLTTLYKAITGDDKAY